MNKTIICILGFLLLVGCQSQSFEQAVKNSFDNYLDTTVVDYKYVMLIPNSGCTGCISDGVV